MFEHSLFLFHNKIQSILLSFSTISLCSCSGTLTLFVWHQTRWCVVMICLHHDCSSKEISLDWVITCTFAILSKCQLPYLGFHYVYVSFILFTCQYLAGWAVLLYHFCQTLMNLINEQFLWWTACLTGRYFHFSSLGTRKILLCIKCTYSENGLPLIQPEGIFTYWF